MNSILMNLNANLGNLMAEEGTGDWSIDSLLNNLNAKLNTWGAGIVVVIGLIMVIVAVVKIAKGLMSGGRAQTNWVLNIVLFFLGGALAFGGGWTLVNGISKGGSNTLNQLGTATKAILPILFR